MKFTRIYILKIMNEDSLINPELEDNPTIKLKKLLITNSNIDMFILLILSLLFFMTSLFIKDSFYIDNPINFITILIYNILLIKLYFVIEYSRITIITWEEYLRGLKKPNTSGRSSLKSNNSLNNDPNKKIRIEMDNLDEKKNPFITKEEPKEDINDINERLSYQNISNNSKLNTTDKFINKMYYFYVKIINWLINRYKNNQSEDKNKKKFSIIRLILRYPHTINSVFHFLKFFIILYSFGLSFAFWLLYEKNKNNLKNYSFNIISRLIGELLELYCVFRIIYFCFKIIFNIILAPIYFSALYLGFIEDRFNKKLNDSMNTRIYTNEDCLLSRDSINKLQKNEIDNCCSICLCTYKKGNIISTLPCSKRHTFHTFCLEEWFSTNVCCPLCRCDFSAQIGALLPENSRSFNVFNVNNLNEDIIIEGNNINNIQNENQNINNNDNNRVNVEMMNLNINNNMRNNNV